MKIIPFLLGFLLLSLQGQSCGNEYGHTINGMRSYTHYYLMDYMRAFDTTRIHQKINAFNRKKSGEELNFKDWSNLSLNLMKLGEADSAVRILAPLVKEHPNEYILTANLGTAYELVGELDSALKYISKGFTLNPKSHRGSEWIHIKILKAKLNEIKNKGSLSGMPIVTKEVLMKKMGIQDPRQQASRPSRMAEILGQQIFLQIKTRVPFTPPPNKVIANLLTTLGDFNRTHGTYENALLAFGYGLEFAGDGRQKNELKNKIKSLNRDQDKYIKDELPNRFIPLMKRSQLDPDLLVYGLDEFAQQLDSEIQIVWAKEDSMALLIAQVDSLSQQVDEYMITQESKMAEPWNGFWLVIVLLVTVLIVVLFIKIRKGS